MSERPSRVLLTSVSGTFEARVLQARLRAEGIQSELRGAVDGPYPFTVGGLAEVQVYVPPEQVDDARLVLLATEVDSAFEAPTRPRPTTGAVAAAVMLALVLLLVVARLAAAL